MPYEHGTPKRQQPTGCDLPCTPQGCKCVDEIHDTCAMDAGSRLHTRQLTSRGMAIGVDIYFTITSDKVIDQNCMGIATPDIGLQLWKRRQEL